MKRRVLAVRMTARERSAALEALGAKLAGDIDPSCGYPTAAYEGAQRALGETARSVDVLALLRLARDTIAAEVDSYGEAEIRQNPIISAHRRVKYRLDRAIARLEDLP